MESVELSSLGFYFKNVFVPTLNSNQIEGISSDRDDGGDKNQNDLAFPIPLVEI